MGESKFYKDHPDAARELFENVMSMSEAAIYAEQVLGQPLIKSTKQSLPIEVTHDVDHDNLKELEDVGIAITQSAEEQGLSSQTDNRRLHLARQALRKLRKV